MIQKSGAMSGVFGEALKKQITAGTTPGTTLMTVRTMFLTQDTARPVPLQVNLIPNMELRNPPVQLQSFVNIAKSILLQLKSIYQ